jgi:transcriptional regulator with XRE-family HTH domain
MTAAKLKKWMEQNGKTVVDIAAALSLAPNTVSNYLKGKPVHRSTQALLNSLVGSPTPGRRKEAVG